MQEMEKLKAELEEQRRELEFLQHLHTESLPIIEAYKREVRPLGLRTGLA